MLFSETDSAYFTRSLVTEVVCGISSTESDLVSSNFFATEVLLRRVFTLKSVLFADRITDFIEPAKIT
jgi:hypothetical protein